MPRFMVIGQSFRQREPDRWKYYHSQKPSCLTLNIQGMIKPMKRAWRRLKVKKGSSG